MQVPAGHPEKPEGADGFKMLERMNGGHHEELALWGLSFLPIGEADRVLDIGCGGGANIARLLARVPRGSAVGVDYSPVSVQATREHNAAAVEAGRCEVLEGNASALPLPDASFDVATAFETVYYWDLPTAFAEVKRVLKPGGRFMVCNEADGSDADSREYERLIPGMFVYTPEEIAGALSAAGFHVVGIKRVLAEGRFVVVVQKPY
jgi:SAM-dependent methyltransferase